MYNIPINNMRSKNEALKHNIYHEVEEILTKKTICSGLFVFNKRLAKKEALDTILHSELFETSKLQLIKTFELSDTLNNSQASSSCLIL